jgi:hypothetical protein
MADAFFARTAQSCKENPLNIDDIAAGDSLPTGRPVHGGMPAAAFGPTRPRGLVMGDSMYIAGLAPAIRIGDILDIPEDLRDQMRAAAERRIASVGGSGKAAAAHSNEADFPASAFPNSTAGKPETGQTNKAYAVGPVFCTTEVTAARKLLGRLKTRRFMLVGPAGLRMEPGVIVRPEICWKLAAIGMIAVTEIRGGLLVRRAPDSIRTV